MEELRAWTPEEIAALEERIRNAAPGSKFDQAKKYGIDLSLLSPAERVRQMLDLAESVEPLRGALRKR